VEVTEDLLNIDPLVAPHTSRRHTPYPIFEDPSSELWSYRNTVSKGNNLMAPER
jgi:hypothetical protein